MNILGTIDAKVEETMMGWMQELQYEIQEVLESYEEIGEIHDLHVQKLLYRPMTWVSRWTASGATRFSFRPAKDVALFNVVATIQPDLDEEEIVVRIRVHGRIYSEVTLDGAKATNEKIITTIVDTVLMVRRTA